MGDNPNAKAEQAAYWMAKKKSDLGPTSPLMLFSAAVEAFQLRVAEFLGRKAECDDGAADNRPQV